MLKEVKKLMDDYGDPRNNMAAKEFRRDLNRVIRAVREECAKKCDAQAAFYERLREKGPGGKIDSDLARAMGAEDCASAIRSAKGGKDE